MFNGWQKFVSQNYKLLFLVGGGGLYNKTKKCLAGDRGLYSKTLMFNGWQRVV